MRYILTIALAFTTINLFSQDFKWESKIDSVPTDGFHNIKLTPSVINNLNENFSDLRIYDNSSKETPYMMKNENTSNIKMLFEEYKIIKKQHIRNHCTNIIIHNKNKKEINNISLIIKNSDVQKKAKLSGSNDLKNWYIIKDNYLFQSVYSNSDTSEIKLLDFPLSNYEYFKLEINDSLNVPINILKAGYYDTYTEKGKYSELVNPKIIQTDSSKIKKSYIKISFPEIQFINKLEFKANSPEYYHRKAGIYFLKKIKKKKGITEQYFENIATFELSSGSSNSFDISGLKAKEFYLIIDNEDNLPLKISSIKAFQLNCYLTAFLKKGMSYFLRFGNEKLNAPVYDLEYFKDKIPGVLPVISIQSPKDLRKEKPKQTNFVFFTNRFFIWFAIAVVAVFLLFMTFKITKEVGSKNNSSD